YAVVIPAEHASVSREIRSTYQALHQALGEALNILGVKTKPIKSPSEKGGSGDFPATPGHCFEEPVAHDLSLPLDGTKVAGAAMKRGREGLLLQGSIDKTRLGHLPWNHLAVVFAERLAAFFETTVQESNWPMDWEKNRRPFLEEIESPAWQRR
ncbi:MAG: hypothetical protein VB980_04240, partial [Opitutales bacterium]